jgi:hypothetical protein
MVATALQCRLTPVKLAVVRNTYDDDEDPFSSQVSHVRPASKSKVFPI